MKHLNTPIALVYIFITILFFSNCRTSTYIPSPAYTPFMADGKDLQVGASVNIAKAERGAYQNESLAAHLAYRPGARFLLAASGNLSEEMQDIDLMGGGYMNDAWAHLSLEVLGGYGFTNLKNASYYRTYLYSGSAHRFFFQTGVLSMGDTFRFGGYGRLSLVRLENFDPLVETRRTIDGGLVFEGGPIFRTRFESTSIEVKGAANLQMGSVRPVEFTYGISVLQDVSFSE